MKHPNVLTCFLRIWYGSANRRGLKRHFDRIASYMEKTLKPKQRVQAAMIYPAVVVTMAGAITVLLMVACPDFASIYASFGRELPALTQVLINISSALQHQLPFYLAGIGLCVFAGALVQN